MEQIREDPTTLYDLLEKMGEGSYGSVYKALDKKTSEIGSFYLLFDKFNVFFELIFVCLFLFSCGENY